MIIPNIVIPNSVPTTVTPSETLVDVSLLGTGELYLSVAGLLNHSVSIRTAETVNANNKLTVLVHEDIDSPFEKQVILDKDSGGVRNTSLYPQYIDITDSVSQGTAIATNQNNYGIVVRQNSLKVDVSIAKITPNVIITLGLVETPDHKKILAVLVSKTLSR